MTFNTHELRELGVDVQSSIRQMLHSLQCKPVGTTLIQNVSGNGASGLCNIYDTHSTINAVALYESTVKRKLKVGLRITATKLFLEFLSAKIEEEN